MQNAQKIDTQTHNSKMNECLREKKTPKFVQQVQQEKTL
jgi:hypothetical protein